jgi:hypothetical protein
MLVPSRDSRRQRVLRLILFTWWAGLTLMTTWALRLPLRSSFARRSLWGLVRNPLLRAPYARPQIRCSSAVHDVEGEGLGGMRVLGGESGALDVSHLVGGKQLHPIWLKRLVGLKRPSARALVSQLSKENALGFDAGPTLAARRGTLFDYVVGQKKLHPDKVRAGVETELSFSVFFFFLCVCVLGGWGGVKFVCGEGPLGSGP